jgi:hypothetical protein
VESPTTVILCAPQRLTTNLLHFRTNYAIVTFVVLVVCVLTSPLTIAVLGLCAGLFVAALGWRRPVQVLGRTLSNKDRMLAVGAGALQLIML